MKLKQKLVAVFIAVSLLVGLVGFLGLYANNQIVNSFESREEHFGSIIEASNEVSSYAKRAEGHLMLYLTLHNESDKQKFFSRLASLREQNSIMDEKVKDPEARKILDDINSKTDELQSTGEALVQAYDNEIRATGRFELENHQELIRNLDDTAAEIRADGLKLIKIEVNLRNEQDQAAQKNAANLYNVILIISAFAVFGALALGYVIARNIANPIMRLKEAAVDIGRGNLGTKIEIGSTDEIGELAGTFNMMVQNLQTSSNERMRAEERLSKLNECFLVFGTQPIENINRLTALCGELMGATAALYNRLDKGMLCSWGQWNLPHGYKQLDNPAGHICYDTINRGSDEINIIHNLPETVYAHTDPNVTAYKLQTYIGRAIKFGDNYVGSLCVVYQNDYFPSEDDKRLMGVIASAIGIEENRMQAEEELLKFRLGIERSADAIFITDTNGTIIYINPAFEKIYGYGREEALGKTPRILKSGILPQEVYKQFWDTLLAKKAMTGEIINKTKDGRLLNTESSANPIMDKEGNIIGFLAIQRDITRRKQADEKIREQASLLDKAQDAIYVRDMENHIIYWNKSAERLYGWTAEEVIGKDASKLLYTKEPPRLIEARKNVIGKGEWLGELYQVTRDGKEIIVESRWTLTHDGEGKPKSILIINTDITGKKKLEAQLLRAQRMESIGTLASGIAHDINNVLSPIMLSLQLLQERFTDDESQKLIGILERSAQRGAGLIKQVQSFARGIEGERKALQVIYPISEIRQIANETFPRNIEVKADIPKDLWTIYGDATQLHQVLMNLSVNARDAMPDGGILSISAENISIDESFARVNVEARVGPYVAIAVSDTGTGIPAKIMDRIFEPFFTTKAPGKGTGLGLSTALAIVKSHGGFINVYSEVGNGTVFKVYLPAVTTAGTQKAQVQQPELPTGNGECILVVDDEAQIREITRASLEKNGYRVLTASDGAEAIPLYSQNRDRIKIVLMDMMMPVMDGPASINELREIDPQVRIIAVSGLTEGDKYANITGKVHAFLSKPYTTEKLIKTIHEVLNAKHLS